jgi:hypothetical protein
MVKMLAMGEMKVYAFNLQRADKSMSELNALIMGENIKDSMDKISQSAEFLKCTLTKGEVLYIPQGWYVMEVASKGPLCYGVRKSFLLDTVEGKACYNKSKNMLQIPSWRVYLFRVVLRLYLFYFLLHSLLEVIPLWSAVEVIPLSAYRRGIIGYFLRVTGALLYSNCV